MKHPFQTIRHEVDVCVVGGGLAGVCAAIASARTGAKTLIMQDRPMFGGNASSEIRMWICGAHGENNRETGLVEEFLLENHYRNPYRNFSLWDSILYEKVRFQENLSYLLNCSCLDADMNEESGRIRSVTGWQLTTQQYHQVNAALFIDCSGDSILAPLTGADFRMGRESRTEFGEDIAPEAADRKTMGMSCLIQTRETEQSRPFIPPFWAERLSADKMPHRLPNPRSENYWFLELGGEQDAIADTEAIRDDLQSLAYGMWDFVKNSGVYEGLAEHLEADWIGMLPGKRESRRYVGDHLLTQQDIRSEGHFHDVIAYGGWSMDDHHPAGFRTGEPPTIFHPAPSPYGIPYRCLYSRNIENLMFAGRNISVTHTAMSSTRVMATCGLLGQAAGTAAALAIRFGTTPRGVGQCHMDSLQQQLMDDDCHLPHFIRRLPPASLDAACSAISPSGKQVRMTSVLQDGIDRPIGKDPHAWDGPIGSVLQLRLTKTEHLKEIRLVFDSDLNRSSLPLESRDRPMKCIYLRNEAPWGVPQTLIRHFRVEAQTGREEWTELAEVTDNHQRLVRLPVSISTDAVRLVLLKTWGSPNCRLFAFDVR
jgi:hypothetical protein